MNCPKCGGELRIKCRRPSPGGGAALVYWCLDRRCESYQKELTAGTPTAAADAAGPGREGENK